MIRNVTSVIAQTLVTVLTLFALYAILLQDLGAELLGLWSLVLGATSASRIAELGLAGGVVKFVAKYYARNDPNKAAQIIETAAISIAVLVGVLSPVAYLVIDRVLDAILPAHLYPQARHVLPFSLCSLWLICISGVFQSGLDARQRFDLRAIAACTGQVVFFVAAITLVRVFGFEGLAYAQVVQSLVMVSLTWLLVRREIPSLHLVPSRWVRATFREIVGYATAFQANGVAQLLFEPTTKILLSKFGGVSSVAYYEMANRMVSQLRSILVTSAQVVVPKVAEMMEKEPQQVPALYARFADLLVFITVIAFAALALVTPTVSRLWIGHYEPTFVGFAYILIMAWWLNCLTVPAYQMYLGIGRMRWNSAGHVTMGLLNAALGAGLGWALGAFGVMAGMALALIGGSAISLWAFHSEFQLRWSRVVSRGTRRLYVICLALVVFASLAVPSGPSSWLSTAGTLVVLLACVSLVSRDHPAATLIRDKLALLIKRPASR